MGARMLREIGSAGDETVKRQAALATVQQLAASAAREACCAWHALRDSCRSLPRAPARLLASPLHPPLPRVAEGIP